MSDSYLVALPDLTTHVTGRGVEVSPARPLESAVSCLAPVLADAVFPFLEAHCTLASLDRLMNGEDRFRSDRMPEPSRSMHAILVAYFDRNPDFPRLISEYREGLLDIDEEELARYDSLVAYLAERAIG
jgi:hypothetical protein